MLIAKPCVDGIAYRWSHCKVPWAELFGVRTGTDATVGRWKAPLCFSDCTEMGFATK